MAGLSPGFMQLRFILEGGEFNYNGVLKLAFRSMI